MAPRRCMKRARWRGNQTSTCAPLRRISSTKCAGAAPPSPPTMTAPIAPNSWARERSTAASGIEPRLPAISRPLCHRAERQIKRKSM
eukprot:2909048-Pyramimonas_sp.AAC.2